MGTDLLRTADLPAPDRMAVARLSGAIERLAVRDVTEDPRPAVARCLARLDGAAAGRVATFVASIYLEDGDGVPQLALVAGVPGVDVGYAYRIAMRRAHDPCWVPLSGAKARLLDVECGRAEPSALPEVDPRWSAPKPLPARGRPAVRQVGRKR